MIPAFLAAQTPAFSCRITVAPAALAIAPVESREPSSITMISIGARVCARTHAIVFAMNLAALYAGMTTEILIRFAQGNLARTNAESYCPSPITDRRHNDGEVARRDKGAPGPLIVELS
jgi:hypothetical protein